MRAKPYSLYKPSGVEWLGDVPEGWKVKRLKYSASINDEALPETTPPDLQLKYVDIGGVDAVNGITAVEDMVFDDAPSRARRIVRDGDTIVSTVRTYLRAISPIRKPPDNLIVSTGFAVVRPREINPKYLSYALRESRFVETVVARSVGVSYPAVNASEVATISITLPPKDEQQVVADFLDRETARINTLVAKKRTLIERLKEKRTALISLTVTRGLPPGAAHAAGLDPHPKLKPSGIAWLGDILAHWDVSPIKFLVSTAVTDGPHETPEIIDEGVPFVSAEAISNGRINFDAIRGHISEEDHKRYSKKYRPKLGDIFMVKSGATTGRIAMVETDIDFNIWSPLAAIRCNPNLADRHFVYLYLQSREFQTAVELSWSFGTQQNIGMGVIQNLAVPVPLPEEQAAIADFLNRETAKIDQMVAKVEIAIEQLREYRTALINAAVTGKIDVRGQSADNRRILTSAS